MEEHVEEVTTVTEHPTQVVRTRKQIEPAVQTEHPQKVYQKKKAIFRSYQIVWYLVGLIEVLLGFRLSLLALGANPSSGFTSLIYAVSGPFAIPFQGIVASTVTPEGSVFEWSTLIAAAVYLIIGVGIVQIMQLVKPVTPQEVSDSVDNT